MVENNTWIRLSPSRTAVIFVHGILSNSDACWRNTKAYTYWPDLVRNDPQFEDPAIFVSGYTAGLGAGLYDVRSAADDTLAILRNPGTRPAPLDKDRLLFVCHSQGGIVVRQMLCAHFEQFRGKRVGVVLCGSPSWGSFYGTVLAPIAFLVRFRQATALSWGGSTLRNLDRDFLDLLDNKRIPDLTGICMAETRGRILGIPVPKMVAEPSATRYFRWYPIPKTTHSSLVKPGSMRDMSHVRLRDFALTHGFLTRNNFKAALTALLANMTRVPDAYGPGTSLGKKGKAETVVQLSQDVRRTLELADRHDRLAGIPLATLLDTPIAGDQHWAFHGFSREQFVKLWSSLNTLLGSLP